MTALPFTVLIDDNFHYMDESERTTHGRFATIEEATMAARQIVDEFLDSAYKPGMSGDELLTSYVLFGEDPFIVSSDPAYTGILFSARTYARWKIDLMCATPADGESGTTST